MPGSCPKIFRHAMVWILETEISADPGVAEAVCMTEGTLCRWILTPVDRTEMHLVEAMQCGARERPLRRHYDNTNVALSPAETAPGGCDLSAQRKPRMGRA
jgi:hypothetical protein